MPRNVKQQRYKNNFMMVANAVFKDETLSLQAKGLFGYLWSLPEQWEFHLKEIVQHATNGRDATQKAIKELETRGYIHKVLQKDAKGRFASTIWYFDDKPVIKDTIISTNSPRTENPYTVNPCTDNPEPEDQGAYKIYITNNKQINNKRNIYSSTATVVEPQSQIDKIKQEFESIWQKYPVKQNKKKAFSSYKAWRNESKEHTLAYLEKRLAEYLKYCKINQEWYRPMNGGTWFGGRFEDELDMTPPKTQQTYQRKPQYVERGTDWKTTQPVIDTSPALKESPVLSQSEINSIFARFSTKSHDRQGGD